MNNLLRRIRGMLGLGTAWAVVWAPIGAGIVTIQYAVNGFGFPPLELLGPILLSGAKSGFLAGFLFGGGLSLAFRRRTFTELRPAAFGAIGAIAAMTLPAGTVAALKMAGLLMPQATTIALMLGFAGALGAATAVGSLKLAQASPIEIDGTAARGVIEP